LIPKYLRDNGIAEVVRVFIDSPPPDVNRYHPILDVLFVSTLDGLVNRFQIGFYNDGSSVHFYSYTYASAKSLCENSQIHILFTVFFRMIPTLLALVVYL